MTDFSDFWAQYPRKIARAYAEKCWNKLPLPARVAALEALPNYNRHWREKQTEWEHIPHASTWINQRRWEDELPPPKVNGAQPSAANRPSAPSAFSPPIHTDRSAGAPPIPTIAPVRIHEVRPIGEIITTLRLQLASGGQK